MQSKLASAMTGRELVGFIRKKWKTEKERVVDAQGHTLGKLFENAKVTRLSDINIDFLNVRGI
jgi:hypothetical protein